MIWWANKDPLPPLDPQAIKPILKALLDNTKDKNTVVRAYSDQAIVNLLKMRQGEEVFQVGARAPCLPGQAVGIGPADLRDRLKHHTLPCPPVCMSVEGQVGIRDWSNAGNHPLFL